MNLSLNVPGVINQHAMPDWCGYRSQTHPFMWGSLTLSHEGPPCLPPDTHALVSLLQNLNKANYHLPIMVTDSGKPPMTNITDLRVQVCSCKNSKVDCNAAGALHFSVTSVLLVSLFSLACK